MKFTRIAAAIFLVAGAGTHAQIPVTDPTAGRAPYYFDSARMLTDLVQIQSNLMALSAHVHQMCLQQQGVNLQAGIPPTRQCIAPVAPPIPPFQVVPERSPQ